MEFSEEMAGLGKTVIVAALDGTFQRKVRHASTCSKKIHLLFMEQSTVQFCQKRLSPMLGIFIDRMA